MGAAVMGLACASLWLVAEATVPAAAATAGEVVRCESEDLRRTYCAMEAGGGVDLVRQLSETPCIRESDWGVDGQGVWVTRGCRAEFRARGASSSASRHVIRCESPSGRSRSCAVALRGAPVRLLRQLSSPPCRFGESWGVGRNEIWVARGCKGEFEVGDRDAGFPPGPRLLTCESKGLIKRTCGTTIDQEVFLVRQLSDTACEEGRNWGWDEHGVWVDDGCRAEFAVQ
ncbi:hypothetical protein B1992_00800 [Pseudoxanthomonas broegbernensis]|uniref:DUF3011 domain-containing protein n=2 Tax=Pseudoxanthomonas broegbernensis TaxID=83619 RepID=A0A7V8GQC3_9GAMM|nr:DUF3011 domain-containing protein [Pseudoxanthomonas broegbernensis]KAF1688211.1 hypothetical protein B1992_00800 [Pseudoxanthomonas broegbernensis]